jgi:hypothetical protein
MIFLEASFFQIYSGTYLNANVESPVFCLINRCLVCSFPAKLKFPQYTGDKEKGNHMKFMRPDSHRLQRSTLAVKIAEKLREAWHEYSRPNLGSNLVTG